MLIRINYYAINKAISDFIDTAKEVSREINQMEEVFEDLSVFWDGESSMEFAMRVNADLYTANAMVEGIRNKAGELIEASKRFNNAEVEVQNLIEEM